MERVNSNIETEASEKVTTIVLHFSFINIETMDNINAEHPKMILSK